MSVLAQTVKEKAIAFWSKKQKSLKKKSCKYIYLCLIRCHIWKTQELQRLQNYCKIYKNLVNSWDI